ncbi:MAG: thioredoxin domain-containing protein, partial [Gammaproteobacteria bacterium]|nr:thioredoxin domain-containing protein [Gammaproteobacteria bacterium]
MPFRDLALRVAELWKQQREDLVIQGDRIAEAVADITNRRTESGKVDSDVIRTAVQQILQRHDKSRGGFSQAPKFPNEPLLFLLLEAAERYDSSEALTAAETTLDAMARGGIHDQVAGGFHRYSTDNKWLVPHFEKMLYNQAHLGRAFLLAWRLSGNPFFKRTAIQTLNYVLRDMTSAHGAFYSATDADSEGEEGVFFLWTREQITDALSEQD